MTDRFITVPDSLELPAAVKVGVDRLHDSTPAGRALLTGADAAAQRSSLGLGTAATASVGDFEAAGTTAAAFDVVAVDQITLTAPLALTIPAGFPAGQVYRVTLTQDGTGGHPVTYGGSPVTVDLTAGAVTTVELHPAGAGYVVRYPGVVDLASLSSTYVSKMFDLPFTVDVDVDEAIADMDWTQVDLTTYVGGTNEIVHPSLLFFDAGWNGWRYWMAYTPFNGGSIEYENPSIAVSNDGETWTTPAGLTNPVIPRPGDGYNADPNLFMSPDGTLNMVWKAAITAGKETRLTTTTDGVTWTAPVALFLNAFEDVSPVVLYDNGQYRMWTIKHNDTPNTMYVRTADAPEGPWSAPVACTVSLPISELWHIDIKRVGQQYHCVAQAVGNQFVFGKSNDGLAWEFGPGMMPYVNQYKAGILPKMTPGGLVYDMWFSRKSPFILHKTTVTFDRSARLREIRYGIVGASLGTNPYLVGDTFTRADSVAGLGTTSDGKTWTNVMGGPFGIQSGKAYLTAAGNSRAVVDIGVSDFRAGVTFSTLGASGWLMFRYLNASNLWRIGNLGVTLFLEKIVAGVRITNLQVGAVLLDAGDRIEVECVGSSITVYRNGLECYQITDTDVATGTQLGFNIDNTTARFDDLNAWTL